MPDRTVSPGLIVLLTLVSGGALLLCFPPFDYSLLTWIALVPFFWALHGVRRPAHGLLLALLLGLVFFAGLHRYLLIYGSLPTLLVGLVETLPLLIFGYLAVRVLQAPGVLLRVAALAALWVLAEWLRAHLGPLSLPLGRLGHTQYAVLPLLQSASLFGALGLSFMIALLNATLAETLWLRRTACGGACATSFAWIAVGAFLAVAYLGGVLALHWKSGPHPTLTVGVVQGNVDLHTPVTPQDAELCRQVYPAITAELMQRYADSTGDSQRPKLIVWPETALPVMLNLRGEYTETAREVAQQHQIWLLLGALEKTLEGEIRNKAWLFDPRGLLRGTYAKNDLVMFGEYVPWRDRLPFIKRYPLRSHDFTPGRQRNLLDVEAARFGTLICFEAIFPDPARVLVQRGAEFLVFITSDAWAGRSPEVLLHSHTAPFRAVETGRWVIRAATTGVSAIISPQGKLVESVPAFTTGAVASQISLRQHLTPYSRWGDWPLFAISLLLAVAAIRARPLPPQVIFPTPEARFPMFPPPQH